MTRDVAFRPISRPEDTIVLVWVGEGELECESEPGGQQVDVSRFLGVLDIDRLGIASSPDPSSAVT